MSTIDNNDNAVPVEGDRERLAALLHGAIENLWNTTGEPSDMEYQAELLIRAGVSLTGSGLREAIAAMPEATYEETAYGSVVNRAAVLAILSGESGE